MSLYSRITRPTGMLADGQEVTYAFSLISHAKVLEHQFGYPFPGRAKDDFRVRELFRYVGDDKKETLIRDPTDEWRSEWAQWKMMPPLSFEELHQPKLAIIRLHGSEPALKLWL